MGSYISCRASDDEHWRSDALYAMETARACVICGGPFDLQGEVYNIDPKEPRYQWLSEIRLLGYIESVKGHRVTSELAAPINTSNLEDVFLSEKCWYNSAGSGYFRVLNESRSSDIWFDALLHPSQNAFGTLFPLHHACITISCRAIEHKFMKCVTLDNRPPLAILCNILNRVYDQSLHQAKPVEQNHIKNDMFHLASCSNIHGPKSVLALTRLDWWGGEYDRFYTNPLDVPERLSSFVFNLLLGNSSAEVSPIRKLTIVRDPQSLERLPMEILGIICNYIPARTVIALNRTSKVLSLKIPLNNAFWRDRLRDSSLHPHIWDLDTQHIERLLKESNINFSDAGWDWRGVAKLLAMKQFPTAPRDRRLDDLPLGLWNRCRIWGIIEEHAAIHLDTLYFDRNDSIMEMADLNTALGPLDTVTIENTI